MKNFFKSLKNLFRVLFSGKSKPAPPTTLEDGGDQYFNEDQPVPAPSPPPPPPEFSSRYAWMIDCGHTQFTPGKRSPKLSDGRQLLEYEINHWIGDRLIKRLRDRDLEVFRTCRADEFQDGHNGDDLRQRCLRANNYITRRPKLFVSIHHNAFGRSGWTTAHGTETYLFTRPTNEEASEKMGRAFQRCLVEGLGTRDRGLLRANFQVLRQTAMPACLLEVEFFNNEEKVLRLFDEDFRNRTVDAIEKAILEIEAEGLPGYPFVV